MLLYYITDRTQFAGGEHQRRRRLLDKISEAAHAGVDYVQLRERDLSGRELEALAEDAVELIAASRGKTRLLINSRNDVALSSGARGVHLRSNDVTSAEVRKIWQAAGRKEPPIIGVSCHSQAQVSEAKKAAADFVVFGPVYEKQRAGSIPCGLDELCSACRHGIRVLALGGVARDNVPACIEAGASGIAGIRLFQENEIVSLLTKVRDLN